MSKQTNHDNQMTEIRAALEKVTKEYMQQVNTISQLAINSGLNQHAGLDNSLIGELLGAATEAYNIMHKHTRHLRLASSNASNSEYSNKKAPIVINDHFSNGGKRKRKTRKHRR